MSIDKISPLRLLVSSSDMPDSWRPPQLTASLGDTPILVEYKGQKYWAVAPNVPHDIDRVNGPMEGFATIWDGTKMLPNTMYPPLTYKDEQGRVVQQGDLVFQLPAHSDSNNAFFRGLALIRKSNPTDVLAVAEFEDWGPRLNPNDF